MTKGKLIIGCTPIGNPEDFTLRLIRWLKDCDLLVVEIADHTLSILKNANMEYNKNYIEYNELMFSRTGINDPKMRESKSKIFSYLNDGKSVLLISDEGTPTINDPGFGLIERAYSMGYDIEVLPGPSVVTTSYVHAMSMENNYSGYGFIYLQIMNDAQQLENSLQTIKNVEHAIITTVVNDHFIANGLSKVLENVLGNRSVAICQNITYPDEKIIKTDLKNINQYLGDSLNTIVIYPRLF
jgi:16S rRNA (cytidine1402-2'-O)-methyltransferase